MVRAVRCRHGYLTEDGFLAHRCSPGVARWCRDSGPLRPGADALPCWKPSPGGPAWSLPRCPQGRRHGRARLARRPHSPGATSAAGALIPGPTPDQKPVPSALALRQRRQPRVGISIARVAARAGRTSVELLRDRLVAERQHDGGCALPAQRAYRSLTALCRERRGPSRLLPEDLVEDPIGRFITPCGRVGRVGVEDVGLDRWEEF